jgi:hypothetical protein
VSTVFHVSLQQKVSNICNPVLGQLQHLPEHLRLQVCNTSWNCESFSWPSVTHSPIRIFLSEQLRFWIVCPKLLSVYISAKLLCNYLSRPTASHRAKTYRRRLLPFSYKQCICNADCGINYSIMWSSFKCKTGSAFTALRATLSASHRKNTHGINAAHIYIVYITHECSKRNCWQQPKQHRQFKTCKKSAEKTPNMKKSTTDQTVV